MLFLFSSLRGVRTVLKVCRFDFSCVGIYSFFRNSLWCYGLLVYSITFNLSLSHVSFASLIIENSLIWLEQEFLRIIVVVIFKADLTVLVGETKRSKRAVLWLENYIWGLRSTSFWFLTLGMFLICFVCWSLGLDWFVCSWFWWSSGCYPK